MPRCNPVRCPGPPDPARPEAKAGPRCSASSFVQPSPGLKLSIAPATSSVASPRLASSIWPLSPIMKLITPDWPGSAGQASSAWPEAMLPLTMESWVPPGRLRPAG